ncbi:prolyl oligopeptidase family serine peptidase, partial [candidate division KSB1 bacterium]
DVVTAPTHLNTSYSNLGPDGEHFLNSVGIGLATLEIYGKPFVTINESEFDYLASRSRNLTLRRTAKLDLFNYKTGNKISIEAPKNGWISGQRWSPDGTKVAYYGITDDEVHIYVAEVKNGKSKKITKTPVLATLATSFSWTGDSKNIATVLYPKDRPDMPEKPAVADEPLVRVFTEGETSTRTYNSVLEGNHDSYSFELLEWLATGQLALIDVDNRKVTEIGNPEMHRSVSVSPDGQFLRVTTMQKPFSYIVPVSSFGTIEAIFNLQGDMLVEIQKRPLREGGSSGGRGGGNNGGSGRRSLSWRPDGDGMSFLQQEPQEKKEEGEEESDEEDKRKDRVMQWPAPFDSAGAKVIYESENRMGSVRYSEDCSTLYITETQNNEEHLYAVNLNNPDTKYTIYKRKTNGDDSFYKNPGSLMARNNDIGISVVRTSSDGNYVYLQGTQYFEDNMEEAPRPFINKVNIRSGEKETVFESDTDVYETVSAIADDDLSAIFIARQSPTMISDTYLKDLNTGSLTKMTENKNFASEVTRAVRKRFQVERVDGIKFWVNVTLPPNYREGTKLPAMFWFYPREYTGQKNYDESARRYNKNTFPRVSTRSMEILTMLDYAVVQPDWPIVGKEGQMNDNYVRDMQWNAWAVIDALDKKEYIDRDRLGIGGHSYGAFGTANIMIHTPYFKAGIAGDGNYNRTLTPMTFQSERRNLWEAREVYLRMSPLLWADQLSGALLMYHGLDDMNVGTFPIHSPRMFHMLNGLGRDVSLYMYPYEHHGPATVETTLDLWSRWIAWLDKYVKNPEEKEDEKKKRR